MRLTGLSLISVTALLALLVIAGTVLLWSRFGRWRLLTRTVGVVLAEALVVLAIGLVANRSEGFYPSWQALLGDTGTASSTATVAAGRLDASLANGQSSLPWKPAALPSWHLAGTPTVLLPSDYRGRPSTTYPVVLVLAGSAAEAVTAASGRAEGVVTVVATPTAATTVAALGEIGVALGEDVRVTRYGWGLVASTRSAALAAGLVDAVPGRFAGEALIGSGMRPHGPAAFATVRIGPAMSSTPGVSPSAKPPRPGKSSPAGKGSQPGRSTPSGKVPPSKKPSTPAGKPTHKPKTTPRRPLPPGKPKVPAKPTLTVPATTLTAPAGSLWVVATRWAAEQTSQPLQPAVRLPVGANSAGGPPPSAPPSGGAPAGGHPNGRHAPRGHSTGGPPAGGPPAGLLSGGAHAAGRPGRPTAALVPGVDQATEAPAVGSTSGGASSVGGQ
jgi:hypothetical protein